MNWTDVQRRTELHLARYKYRYDDVVTPEKLAVLCETQPRLVRRLARLEVIRPVSGTGDHPRFAVRSVSRLRTAIRLHRQLDVSWTSMSLVLDLLDRVQQLERRRAAEVIRRDRVRRSGGRRRP